LHDLTTEVSTNKDTLIDVSQNLYNLTTEVSTNKGTLTDVSQNLHDLTTEVSTNKNTLMDVSQNLHDLTTEVSTNKNTLMDVSQNLHDLTTEVSTNKNTLIDVSQNLHDLTTEVSTNKNTLIDVSQNLHDLTTEVSTNKNTLMDVSQNLYNLNDEVSTNKEILIDISTNISKILTGDISINRGFQPTQFYGPCSIDISAGLPATGTMYIVPFFIEGPVAISDLGVAMNYVQSNINIMVGIYANNGFNSPSTKIVEATITTSVAENPEIQTASLSPALTLSRGWYYSAWVLTSDGPPEDTLFSNNTISSSNFGLTNLYNQSGMPILYFTTALSTSTPISSLPSSLSFENLTPITSGNAYLALFKAQ
jgi:hypothetical protein